MVCWLTTHLDFDLSRTACLVAKSAIAPCLLEIPMMGGGYDVDIVLQCSLLLANSKVTPFVSGGSRLAKRISFPLKGGKKKKKGAEVNKEREMN